MEVRNEEIKPYTIYGGWILFIFSHLKQRNGALMSIGFDVINTSAIIFLESPPCDTLQE